MTEAINTESMEQLGEVVDLLQNQSKEMQGKAILNRKLAEVMGAVTRLEKRGFNSHYKYKFATDADVSDLIRAELSQRRVSFRASLVHYERSGTKSICHFEMRFVDGDTGAEEKALWIAEADDKQDKGINKAATAAVKYYLLKTFLISTGDEPDADAEGPVQSKREPSAKAKNLLAGIANAETQEELEGITKAIKDAGLDAGEMNVLRNAYAKRKKEIEQ